MGWKVKMLDEYEEWLDSLDKNTQNAIYEDILVLEAIGPTLSRPYSDTLDDSKLSNLKELRTKYKGIPYRSLYVFDPTQSAVLLVGGNKAKNGSTKRWYKKNIPLAEKRYKKYLETKE